MYSLRAYGKMLAEPVRREAYFRALEQAIRPDSVVLEMGTGPGVFALHAARCGARKVYAVEPGEAIQVARELVAAHGLGDRIELIEGLSTEVELPQRADVVFSDLRGVVPLFANHIPSVVDARARHLAPGGVLIPQSDVLWVAVAEAEELHDEMTAGWREPLGYDFSIPLAMVTSSFTKAQLGAEQLLTQPEKWAELDYGELVHGPVEGRVEWHIVSHGVGHGLVLWFATELMPGVGFSSAPGGPELIYGQAFFPFPRPESLERGDRVAVDLRAVPVGGEYVWSWRTVIEGREGRRREYRQTTFDADPLSLSSLSKRAATFVPRLGAAGQPARLVLNRIDGSRSLGEIARELQATFPELFPDFASALTRVSQIAEAHC